MAERSIATALRSSFRMGIRTICPRYLKLEAGYRALLTATSFRPARCALGCAKIYGYLMAVIFRSRVLDGPVRGFLIGNSLVEEGGSWPDGDRSHGTAGILEFYSSHLGTSDPVSVAKLLNALILDKVRGHWQCPCGSGAIIRKCHKDAVQALRTVPKDILVQSAITIVDTLKKRSADAA